MYGLVAAAVFVLGLGSMVLYYQGALDFSRTHSGATSAYAAPSQTPLPVALAQSLVATHVACGSLHDHHFVQPVNGNTYAALNVKLTADLGFPSIARSIGADWSFKGAGECNVGALRGSHLMFARGDQTVSVFSLPSHCMGGVSPGAMFQGQVDQRPVAGFAQRGAVYAVVGSSASGSLPLDAVVGIRDGLFDPFTDIGCGNDGASETILPE